jgi:multidrug efflux system outer membrane protein
MAALVAGVATSYFNLQSLDEQLAITHRTLDSRQKFVELTQGQHDRGTVSELDVATAQAQLAIAKANVPALKLLIGQTEDQMSVLLGHNPQAISRNAGAAAPSAIDRPPPPVPAAGLPSTLLERRPDVREAEQNLVAANAQVGVAKANLFPSITLTAAGGGVSTALSSLFSGPARTWSLGAAALQPLLSAQRNLYEVDFADAQKRQALLQYQKSVQTAFQEVSDALLARQQDAEVQAAQEEQVDAQRRANTIALARYRVGYASYFNVIDADRELFTAELSLSSARLNTLLSVVQLYRALGGGWQVEQPAGASAPAAAAH